MCFYLNGYKSTAGKTCSLKPRKFRTAIKKSFLSLSEKVVSHLPLKLLPDVHSGCLEEIQVNSDEYLYIPVFQFQIQDFVCSQVFSCGIAVLQFYFYSVFGYHEYSPIAQELIYAFSEMTGSRFWKVR